MDDDKRRELLQQLHDEINNLDTVDKKSSELLRDIDSDIYELLERSGENPLEMRPSMAHRMEDAVSHFECDHPELTALISKVIDSLSNAGI